MTAYELETILGAVAVAGALLSVVYMLPTWIVRRSER